MPTTLDPSLIDEIVRRILSVAQPDRTILFGSAAAGEMTPDSDIDLLVLERAPGNTRSESARIREVLRGMGRPFDIIVMETEWFDDSKSVVGGLAYPADKYGLVVHGAGGDGRPARPADEVKRVVVDQWLTKARESLAMASLLVANGFPHGEPIGFHAQVAAETCLKAFLAEHQIECPKTHDLKVLLGLVARADASLAQQLAEVAVLAPYVLYFDDPMVAPQVSGEDARIAVALARKCCDAVQCALGAAA